MSEKFYMKDKRTSGNMTEYKEHYQYCREFNPIEGGIYNSVYDLTVDSTLFGLDNGAYTDAYFNIIETIRQKIDDKIKHMNGCFKDPCGHAIRVNDWRDIKELYTLADYFMPIVEKDIFGCSAKIEFLNPYRNISSDTEGDDESNPRFVNSSWMWHYDDCPAEFVKLFINLNRVTEKSGCLKYIQDADGSIPVLPSYRIGPRMEASQSQEYANSRVPSEVVRKKLNDGGHVVNVVGEQGSYAIHTPNIIHRASCPKPGTEPRDVLFFFIRPSIRKYSSYLSSTYSYKPGRNVKMYELD